MEVSPRMAVLFSDGIVYRGCCFVVYPCLCGELVMGEDRGVRRLFGG